MLPVKCRLQFSQSSQQTPSQFLNKAMNNCRLGSQAFQPSCTPSMQPDDAEASCSQMRPSLVIPSSQDYVPG